MDIAYSLPAPVNPGDDVTDRITAISSTVRLGNVVKSYPHHLNLTLHFYPPLLGVGLTQIGEKVIASTSGMLTLKAPNRFHVASSRKRVIN